MPTEIFDPTRTSTDAEFSVFTVLSDAGVQSYMYVKADGAISVGAVCIIDTDGTADEGTGTLAATHSGCPVGVAQTAIADDDYGWLQVRWAVRCNSIGWSLDCRRDHLVRNDCWSGVGH